MRLPKIIVTACLLMWSNAASAQDSASQLMLDTGGHMAKITGLIVAPDGNHLVSTGHDQIIRVWDWRAGKTVRTIRGQVTREGEGKFYAVALSPNARWLAAGGSFQGVRLYEFATGQLVALLKGHTTYVTALAFSRDSNRLISGSFDHTAIIWNIETRQLLNRLEGHTDAISSVAFNDDGSRAATAGDDTTLRLWGSDGQLISILKEHTDKVKSVAFSPADGTIASSSWDNTVKFWDGATGQFLRSVAVDCGWDLSYLPNGRAVVCSRGYVVDANTGQVDHRNQRSNGVKVGVSPDLSLAATSNSENGILIWNIQTGGEVIVLAGTGRDIWTLGFSDDSCDLAWGDTKKEGSKENDRGNLSFEMGLPCSEKILTAPRPLSRPATGYSKPVTEHDGRNLVLESTWGPTSLGNMNLLHVRQGSTTTVTFNASKYGFRHQGYTFTPDGKTVLSGGANGHFTGWDVATGRARRFVGHVGYVYAVAVSPSGRMAASGATDKTINIWNLGKRELVATLFRGSDDEWVMWTPEGFFTGSESGAKLVGWHINQGPEKEARFVTADQLRRTFFRPDLVAEKFAGDPKGRVKDEAARLDVGKVLASGAAPEVAILLPRQGAQSDDATVLVNVKISDKGGGIGKLTWRVNGQVKSTTLGGLNENGEISRRLDLASSDNVIEVSAENGQGLVQSLAARVTVKVDEKALKGAPDLYILALGVDDYKEVKRRLQFAVADAKGLSTALATAGKDFYRTEPKVMLLRDNEVTGDRLDHAFDQLGAKVRATDVFVLFMAGHGKTVGGDYYFLPRDINQFTDEGIRANAFGPKQWITWFAKIKAEKSIWIIDTCESGSAGRIFSARGSSDYDAAYKRLKDATGRTIFMSASEQQLAVEGYRGHGVFSYAFMEGLARADQGNAQVITLLGLMNYVDNRVPEISRDMKACEVTRPDDYCQRPVVEYGKLNYPLVPRYPEILNVLNSTGIVVIPKIPTHIVLPPGAELFAQARGANRERELQPGESVTVVSTKEGWAEVAQNGKIIGFAQEDRLLKLRN